jgi:anaerobic magnesium-protoporphyrin IX monomethyl ester cyclase
MKTLLIQPPVRDFYRTAIRTQPIGLAYLAASLEAHGHEVRILDCQTRQKRSALLPSAFSSLREHYPAADRSPFRLYGGYYHFGMGRDEIRRAIASEAPDVVGISSSFTPYHGEALEIARIVKEWDPRKTVVMGGAHVSCDPEGVLRDEVVDYVVLGEGERRFPSLLEKIERGGVRALNEIDGIGYRKGRKLQITPVEQYLADLDTLPFPARDLLDLDRYRVRQQRSTMIITSRGCPQGCAYCSVYRVMGPVFRARSPEEVVREMAACRSSYGINSFDIEDDNFTLDQGRAKRLLELIRTTFGEGALDLSAMNGLSFSSLEGELLPLMKRAGFTTLNLALVSTDFSTRTRMGRPERGSAFDAIVAGAEKAGLDVIAYAIMGMPGQTIEEMAATLIHLMGRRVLIGPSIYYPTPGTILFDHCRQEGLLPSDPSSWRSSVFPVETRDFSRLDLVTLFRLARVINFVKGKMDEGTLEEGLCWREISAFLGGRKPDPKAEGMRESARAGDTAAPSGTGGGDIAWSDLLELLIRERCFFSLHKAANKRLELRKLPTSKRVLDCFFEKAWEKPMRKSRNG